MPFYSGSLSLLLRRRTIPCPAPTILVHRRLRSSSTPSPSPATITPSSKPPSLSARLSFVFDQLDALDRTRSSDVSARDAALRRIQSWRRAAAAPAPAPAPDAPSPEVVPEPDGPRKGPEALAITGARAEVETMSMAEVLRREVELVHPWPEWIELMERLARQRYFDLGGADEGCVASAVPMDLTEVAEEAGFDFSRDWTTVKNACMNFGRDRFDILKSLPRKDLQILVGHGCPSMDPKVVFSAKLIRKLVHLDEGDVCSSCNLRKLCSRGYILTRKEDEARTLDVMRILLIYGFDHVKETVENKPLLKLKSVKTVVRKLIHEITKLSAVPIDPSLPPPVIRKPPPKVKQPPPPPKKRVGRDDVEMKKGDWLCPKCDFMNFAKNNCCLQCDAKRPKRQLLPGEWECPRCNFLNYRRNMSCFHCEHNRPSDEYTNSQMRADQFPPRKRLERPARKSDVSSAWNFDFDDNESDGADVAAFEYADSSKVRESSSVDMSCRDDVQGSANEEFRMDRTRIEGREQKFSEKDSSHMSSVGFDDFDDEDDDIDSYEIDMPKGCQTGGISRMSYSELENSSDSDESSEFSNIGNSKYPSKEDITGPADDDESDDYRSLRSSHLADSWQKTMGPSSSKNHKGASSFSSESRNRSSENFSGSKNHKGASSFSSESRNRSSENFSGNPSNYSEGRHGRTKWNKHFKSSNMHDSGPPFDRNHKGRANQLDNGSRRNVRGNWGRTGGFDDRSHKHLNRR